MRESSRRFYAVCFPRFEEKSFSHGLIKSVPLNSTDSSLCHYIMNILVTGGSGYLGKHVVRFFGAQDFSRRSHLDILNLDDAGLVTDYDVVIHLAAHLSQDPTQAEQCFRTNTEGTVNLLRHMGPNSVFI